MLQILKAVGVVVLGLLALSFGDAVIKLTNADFTLWQIYALRSAVALPILFLVLLFGRGRGRLNWHMPYAPKWVAVRSFSMNIAGVLFFSALPHIPFSTAAAVLNTAPLFIVYMASVFSGTKTPRVVWLALVIGFLGVLVIVRPQAAGFNWAALLVLGCAVFYALTMAVTRTKCKYESPYVLAVSMHIAFVIVGLVMSLLIIFIKPTAAINPFLLGGWSAMGVGKWLVILVLGVALIVNAFCAALGYQIARAEIVAPFEYSYILFGLLWGGLFFGERPDAIALMGMLMIVGGGMVAMRYQAKVIK